jgi:hypothetical protein
VGASALFLSAAGMITHAAYHAAYPLPDFGAPLRIETAHEPAVGIGRVHRIAVRADSAPKIATNDEILAALSTTEYRGASYIADALGVCPQTVGAKMVTPAIAIVTEKRISGRGGKYEWRLL